MHNGMNRRALDQEWRAAGGEILDVNRTGECRYYWPATGEKSAAYDRRRKDATRDLVRFVRRMLRREVAA